jgi:hypothetical protein
LLPQCYLPRWLSGCWMSLASQTSAAIAGPTQLPPSLRDVIPTACINDAATRHSSARRCRGGSVAGIRAECEPRRARASGVVEHSNSLPRWAERIRRAVAPACQYWTRHRRVAAVENGHLASVECRCTWRGPRLCGRAIHLTPFPQTPHNPCPHQPPPRPPEINERLATRTLAAPATYAILPLPLGARNHKQCQARPATAAPRDGAER